mmetsp:Transcript_27176/g.38943  ORF Transcript_27176/g.38943 Transcript_27176/m.38943 type:complete len:310 (-) Transcript_27176:92-1021(-)
MEAINETISHQTPLPYHYPRLQQEPKATLRETQQAHKNIGMITPGETPKKGDTACRNFRNHLGTKTNRSIRMEFNKESVKSYQRQSKIYDNKDWIRDESQRMTAGGFFGHSMVPIDNTTVYRVLLQNTNGIDPSPGNYTFQLGLNTCYDNCVAFIALTETNIEWRHHVNRDNLRTSLNKWWDGTASQTDNVRLADGYCTHTQYGVQTIYQSTRTRHVRTGSLSDLSSRPHALCNAVPTIWNRVLEYSARFLCQNPSRFRPIFNCQVLDTFLNFLFVPNDVNFDCNCCNCINPVGTSTCSTDLALLPEPL